MHQNIFSLVKYDFINEFEKLKEIKELENILKVKEIYNQKNYNGDLK